jgi:hypothetical protein
VLAIVASLPSGDTAADNAHAADWLAGLSQDERNVLAHAAGVKAPSEATWAEVVLVQRRRRPNNEPQPRILEQKVDNT